MNFNDISELKKAGFSGFKTMKELFKDPSTIPSIRGVYLVLNVDSNPPEYLTKGCGGFFKGQDPNVAVEILKQKWVEKTLVVYIGKAGSESGRATLKSRLKQYFSFGQGKNVGHYGGRYI